MSAPTIMGWHLWCSKHLAPLAPEWPKGAIIAQLGLFQEGASDPRIAEEAGGRSVAPEDVAGAIQRAFNAHAPLCCFLPEGIAEAIIASALAGEPYRNPTWPDEMKPKR